MDDVLKKFKQLCLHAKSVDDQDLPRSSEPEYRAVLDYILLHPDRQKEFADAFIELVKAPYFIYTELISYCMYKLRWPELLANVREEIASSHDRRLVQAIESILDAYDDGWNLPGMYEYTGLTDANTRQ